MSSEAAKLANLHDDWARPIFGICGLAIITAFLGLDFFPDWWANTFYVETQCTLLNKRISEHP